MKKKVFVPNLVPRQPETSTATDPSRVSAITDTTFRPGGSFSHDLGVRMENPIERDSTDPENVPRVIHLNRVHGRLRVTEGSIRNSKRFPGIIVAVAVALFLIVSLVVVFTLETGFCGTLEDDQQIRDQIAEEIRNQGGSEELIISQLNLGCLPANAFPSELPGTRGFRQGSLKRIEFSLTGIETISPAAFTANYLSSVEALSFNGNGLESLPLGILDNLPSLISLDLSSNRFLNFEEGFFENLEKLAEINFASNNGLTKIPSGLAEKKSFVKLGFDGCQSLLGFDKDIFQNTQIDIVNITSTPLISIYTAAEFYDQTGLDETLTGLIGYPIPPSDDPLPSLGI